MDLDPSVVWDFAGTLVGTLRERPRQLPATVSRVDPDGTVWLSMPGADGLVPASTTADVGADDAVTVEWWGNAYHVTGNRTSPSVGTRAAAALRRATAAAAKVAREAKGIADAVGQHFWADDNGVHVSNEDGNATGERNILMNSLGILLRQGSAWLASFSDSAVAFYDGLGNTAENIITSIGKAGATIGYAAGRHVTVNDDGMTVYSQDGVEAFDISAIGAPHEEQVLYQIKEIVGSAEGTSNVSGLDTQSPTRQQESGSREVVGWWDGADYPNFNWNRPLKVRALVTISAVGLDENGDTITAEEQLLDDVLDMSTGSSTVSIGDGSILFEYTRSVFNLYTLRATVTGAYLQDESGFVSYSATTTLKVVSGGYVASGSVLRPTMRFGSSSLDGAPGPYSVALGWRALAQSEAQTAIGKYNDNDSANAFEVGNGTADDARSNAFAVGWDGTVTTARDRDTTTWTDVLSSKSSDVNITGFKLAQRGQVVSLWIRFQRTTATSAGAAITVGTLSTAYRPLVEAAAPAPAGAGDAYVLESGSVMYRPQSQLAANTNAYVRVTYLVA